MKKNNFEVICLMVALGIVVLFTIGYLGYKYGEQHGITEAEKLFRQKLAEGVCMQQKNFTCTELGAIYQFCDRYEVENGLQETKT